MKIKTSFTFLAFVIFFTISLAFAEPYDTTLKMDPLQNGDDRGDKIIIKGKLTTETGEPISQKIIKILDINRGTVLGKSQTDFDGIFRFVWDVGDTYIEHTIYDVYEIYTEFSGDTEFSGAISDSEIVRPWTWRPHLTVSIDETSYSKGDTIKINGKVYRILGNFAPIITIFDPINNRILIEQLNDIQSNKRYYDEIIAGGPLWKIDGTYVLEIGYGPNRKAYTTFEYSEEPLIKQETIITPGIIIPNWVKQVAGYWCYDDIDDISFLNGIQYLIKNEIIKVPKSESIDHSQELPIWIKSNACWWSKDQISDTDFSVGIQHLVATDKFNLDIKYGQPSK